MKDALRKDGSDTDAVAGAYWRGLEEMLVMSHQGIELFYRIQ